MVLLPVAGCLVLVKSMIGKSITSYNNTCKCWFELGLNFSSFKISIVCCIFLSLLFFFSNFLSLIVSKAVLTYWLLKMSSSNLSDKLDSLSLTSASLSTFIGIPINSVWYSR